MPSPMDIKHHRKLACQAGRPDVQFKHVLALPSVIPILEKGLLYACPGMQGLRAVRTVDQRRILT